ncbi:Predicted transcriptional regulator, contains HTH domain [Desulfoluna spongiiphila]|uniref:Predicted transcriptional regulator, contains HTH domain n=2 Tax=Desulfoluna spongiiphila TaxID=419481 RepID=A0A1G5CVX6_9BACT|nr:Predicted transcriptional regulator, contains HTH domain [Desulfoluna spongiiphila]
MTVDRSTEYLLSLLHELRNLPMETEWVEFKRNNGNPEEIGEYLSALANSAALMGKVHAYLVWGVDDASQGVVGTTFDPATLRVGGEELESWLLRLLSPKINFRFHSLQVDQKTVVMLEIGAAFRHPVQFKGTEFIRVGSYKKRLKDYPEKERELWRVFDQTPFEREIAAEHVSAGDVLKLLDYPTYFDLLGLPLPEGRNGILDALASDEMIAAGKGGSWNITNLGAVLFAKRLADFRSLKRKALRVVLYKGEGRVETVREQEGTKGYAAGFDGLIGFVTNLLPSNEVIGKAFRKDVPMFPELAIRELVANAIIHQDFHATGTAPMVEIFDHRMEITNPGLPLVKTERFLDSPPKSRNEALASFMRRIGVCEERGSGVDKVVFETEVFQLPAPLFETTDEHTCAVLFSHREFKDMDKDDRIRACYLHACLKYVQRDFMTNTTLRERFGIEDKNSAMASRIIKDAITSGLIRCHDESVGSKARKYLPGWVE